MENKEINELVSNVWSEEVYIETTEHIITGQIFMPKIGKKSRLISDVLNTEKNFIAVKDCKLEYKNKPEKNLERHSFLQVNISSIIILRPIYEN